MEKKIPDEVRKQIEEAAIKNCETHKHGFFYRKNGFIAGAEFAYLIRESQKIPGNIEQEGQSFLETNYRKSVDGINDNIIRAQVSIIIKESFKSGRLKSIEEKDKALSDANKEIERLKGLIEKAFKSDGYYEKFKTENNL